jgi:hypothetical protein
MTLAKKHLGADDKKPPARTPLGYELRNVGACADAFRDRRSWRLAAAQDVLAVYVDSSHVTTAVNALATRGPAPHERGQ